MTLSIISAAMFVGSRVSISFIRSGKRCLSRSRMSFFTSSGVPTPLNGGFSSVASLRTEAWLNRMRSLSTTVVALSAVRYL
jgi:hypothetical protein